MKSNQKEKGVRERGGAMTVQIKVDRLRGGFSGDGEKERCATLAIFSKQTTYACRSFHIVTLFHLAVHSPQK